MSKKKKKGQTTVVQDVGNVYKWITAKRKAKNERERRVNEAAAKEARKIALENLDRKIKKSKSSAEKAKLRIARARLKAF